MSYQGVPSTPIAQITDMSESESGQIVVHLENSRSPKVCEDVDMIDYENIAPNNSMPDVPTNANDVTTKERSSIPPVLHPPPLNAPSGIKSKASSGADSDDPPPQFFAFKRGIHAVWPLKETSIPIMGALSNEHRFNMQIALRKAVHSMRAGVLDNEDSTAIKLNEMLIYLDRAIELGYGNISRDMTATSIESIDNDSSRLPWISGSLPTIHATYRALESDAILEWATVHGDRMLNDFYSQGEAYLGAQGQQDFEAFRQGVADALVIDTVTSISLPKGPVKLTPRCRIVESLVMPSVIDLEALMALQYTPKTIQDDERVSATVYELMNQVNMVELDNSDEHNSDEAGGYDSPMKGKPNDQVPESDSLVEGSAIKQMMERNNVSLDAMSLAILSIESRLKRQGILHDPRVKEVDDQCEDFLDDTLVYQSLGLNSPSIDDGGTPPGSDEELDDGDDDDDEVLWTTYMGELFVADNDETRDGMDPGDVIKLRRQEHNLKYDPEGELSMRSCWRPICTAWLNGMSQITKAIEPLLMNGTNDHLHLIDNIYRKNREVVDLLCPPFRETQVQKFYYPTECRPLQGALVIDGKQYQKLGKVMSLLPLPIGPMILHLLHLIGTHLNSEVEKQYLRFPFLPSGKLARSKIINDDVLRLGTLALSWVHQTEPPLGDRPADIAPLEPIVLIEPQSHEPAISPMDPVSKPKKPTLTPREKMIKRDQKKWDDRYRLIRLSLALEKTVHTWSDEFLFPLLVHFFKSLFNLNVIHQRKAARWVSILGKQYRFPVFEDGQTPSHKRTLYRTQYTDGLIDGARSGSASIMRQFSLLQSHFDLIDYRYEISVIAAMALSWMSSTKTADEWKELTCKAYMDTFSKMLYECYIEQLTSELLKLFASKVTVMDPVSGERNNSDVNFGEQLLRDYNDYIINMEQITLEDGPERRAAVSEATRGFREGLLNVDTYDVFAVLMGALGQIWSIQKAALSHLHSSRVKKAVADHAKNMKTRPSSLFSASGRDTYGPMFGSMHYFKEFLMRPPTAIPSANQDVFASPLSTTRNLHTTTISSTKASPMKHVPKSQAFVLVPDKPVIASFESVNATTLDTHIIDLDNDDEKKHRFSSESFYSFIESELLSTLWVKKFDWSNKGGKSFASGPLANPADYRVSILLLSEGGTFKDKVREKKSMKAMDEVTKHKRTASATTPPPSKRTKL